MRGKINGSFIIVNLVLFLSAIRVFTKLAIKYRIKSVTVMNDHALYPLVWIFVARKLKIPSIYIQHATVSDVFPKLLVHTAMLEGQQSLDTYNRIGNLSTVNYLVGIIRMDGLLGFKTELNSKEGLVVGLCLKRFYPDTLVEKLISNLKKSDLVKAIVLRPHPGSSPDYLRSIEKFNLFISNAREESPVDFLKRIDVLVSGESTIILEAALMKVPTFYFDDTIFEFDLYGYVKHGVTDFVKDLSYLPNSLKSFNQLRVEEKFNRCKYYCDTVNTEFENKSIELVVNYYKSIS